MIRTVSINYVRSFYLHIANVYAVVDKFSSCINAVYKHKNTAVRTQISILKQDKILSLEAQKTQIQKKTLIHILAVTELCKTMFLFYVFHVLMFHV